LPNRSRAHLWSGSNSGKPQAAHDFGSMSRDELLAGLSEHLPAVVISAQAAFMAAVTIELRQQSDNSLQVRFSAPDSKEINPKLDERWLSAYHRRMGR
jgi:hypothetical protein